MPATLIKRWQGFAETFQKVTQPGEMAGRCRRPAASSTSKNGGDLKNHGDSGKAGISDVEEQHERDGGTRSIQNEFQSLSPRLFRMQNFDSTPELSKSSAGPGAGKGQCCYVSTDAQTCKPPRRERKGNLSLKAAFPKLWGYQAGLPVAQGGT